MNRDKIGTQTCYIHQCTNKGMLMYHSMSVFQSCLYSLLCNPYITLQISYLLICTYIACVALSGSVIMLPFIFQSAMGDSAVNPQQTLSDFLLSLYDGHNMTKEVLSEIGICKLNATQLTCLLELPLANLYDCLNIFATWMEDGMYDFATLPYTIKAHLTPEDLATLKSIPVNWKGASLNALHIMSFI